jgi:hypothetical protein
VIALAALVFAFTGIHVGGQEVLKVGYAPAWSPDGARIAFVTRGDLWVADADGTHPGLIVREADTPSWAPDGRRLAFVRDGWVWTVRADGADERKLARGGHPAWSPTGQRIAYDRGGQIFSVRWHGGDRRKLADGEEPAYAPDGSLAFVRGGQILVRGKVVAEGRQPAWAPDSRRLAYVHKGQILVAGRAVARGTQPDWRPAVLTHELLPDFDQRAPVGLTITGEPGRWRLGFTSHVDNVGLGSVMILGKRPQGAARMVALQRVLLTNGRWRSYPNVGRLRYTRSGSHQHWHLMRFDSYELRTLDGRVLVRDRKSGFCLADHYGTAPGDFDRRARFHGNCEQLNPLATRVVQGTSPGFTDRYPAFYHGQNVELTDVPEGVYVLLHRANPTMQLRELRYENSAASVRIRLKWRAGTPSVKVLRKCPASASC